MKTILMIVAALLVAGCAARAHNTFRTNAAAEVKPQSGAVCMLMSPLPATVPATVLGSIDAGKKFYGSVSSLFPVMADEARKLGADAVINIKTGQKVGLFAWATPYGSGTAVKLANPADVTNCLSYGGEMR